ncbi:MAG: glycosyltransferase [Chloroflexi bacterium]|nr:glycosyltransferase [Chloroflexota bacterium]
MSQTVAAQTPAATSGTQPIKVLFITSQWPTPQFPAAAPFVEREVRALREAGVEVDVIAYEGGWSISKYIRAVREMRRCLKQNRYDLIHAYFGQCGLVARAQTRLPVVITYGGSDVEGTPVFSGFNRYKNYILIGVSRTLALLVNQVIVVSDNLGRKLPRKDYHTITIALDLDLFRPMDKQEARRQLGLPQDIKLALFAANPANTRKRYDLAQEVCRIASQTLPVQLVVASKRPPAEVPVFMSACDALLLTSTNEGSPNVVREALACNLPVVSTDVGDVRERIGHLPSCAVVASDKAEDLATSLIRVLQYGGSHDLRQEVLDQDYRIIGQKVVNVYHQLLGRDTAGVSHRAS